MFQRRHFDHLEALERDEELLAWIRSRGQETSGGERGFGIEGGGFFCRDEGPSPALHRLRDALVAAYGANALPAARRLTEERIGTLRTPSPTGVHTPLRDGRGARAPAPFSSRYAEIAQQWLAIDALLGERGPCPDALRSIETADATLRVGEREMLARFALELEARLVALFRSPRPDWGAPMLLGMARLAAIEQTLALGRWRVLDAFPRNARTLAPRPAQSAFLRELEEDAAMRMEIARDALVADHFDERRFNDWEEAANRATELRAGAGANGAIRVRGDRLVPEMWAPVAVLPAPEVARDELDALLFAARGSTRHFTEAMRPLYAYHLATRNCVTELLRVLDEALPANANESRETTATSSLRFIPWVAFRTETPRGGQVVEIPSFRTRLLEDMGRRDSPFAIFLRESNTVTSTIYRPTPRDSWFVFFTDHDRWARPLFGVFNIAAGFAETGWGLARLPFDRAARLRSGAQGIAFSLPELLFLNFRKGSLEYGRRASSAMLRPVKP